MDYRKARGGEELGRIRIVNGQMQIEGTMSPTIRQDLENHRREMMSRHLSDEEYLKSLVLVFSGAYIRAGLVDEG